MAWTTPITFASGDNLTASDLNTYLRDNFNEVETAKASQAGGFFVVSDMNQVEERRIHQHLVRNTASTTSTSFVDLSGSPGPSVTLRTGTMALIIVCAQLWNSSAGATSLMSHEVSGISSLAAADTFSLLVEPVSAGQSISGSYWVLREDVTPGVNTFTAKYRATSGTASFMRRRIMVIPF